MTAAIEVIAQLREAIRYTLHAAHGPLTTTAIQSKVSRPADPLVYRALVAIERVGEVRRAGRLTTAARSEVLWQLVFSDADCSAEFAALLAEIERDEIDADVRFERAADAGDGAPCG